MLWWLHVQILLNSTQFITSGTESNLEGFVWRNQSKTGLESPKTICPTMLAFSQKGLSDVVLSKCPNKSHNFQKFLEHYGAKMLVVNKSGLYRLNLWLVRKLARYFPSRRSTHQNYTKAITKHAVANSSLVVLRTLPSNTRHDNKPTLWPNRDLTQRQRWRPGSKKKTPTGSWDFLSFSALTRQIRTTEVKTEAFRFVRLQHLHFGSARWRIIPRLNAPETLVSQANS